MLKRKADAQPAGEPGKPRSASIRIDGVSAPKNMKIGLVADSSGSKPEPAAAIAKPAAPKTAAVKTAKSAKAAKPASAASDQRKVVPGPQPFAPVPADGGSALPKLGLAAAGLAVAAAMLLYFQFSGGTPAETAEQASLQAAAEAEPSAGGVQPAGAAAAGGLQKDGAGGEDAMVARITAGTLAALRSKQANPESLNQAAAAAPAAGTALYKMVLTAAAQGQSEAYIDQLVNGAYERKEITVPASLIGADGRVDTATLLALFVGN
ncbi:hypothetical protein [Leisingera sp. M523]|uniref:hypothetical protein n=1 Tax=Leisingera sp. M523 TaxID=2867013 RepID=UPI0021A384BB|nr:hypothetical protein [Leisingera sp. M523]UWQ29552.1 hypothetical protein K3557_03045 [Leisingera sp. M523]